MGAFALPRRRRPDIATGREVLAGECRRPPSLAVELEDRAALGLPGRVAAVETEETRVAGIRADLRGDAAHVVAAAVHDDLRSLVGRQPADELRGAVVRDEKSGLLDLALVGDVGVDEHEVHLLEHAGELVAAAPRTARTTARALRTRRRGARIDRADARASVHRPERLCRS